MKNLFLGFVSNMAIPLGVATMLLLFQGCEVVGGIFKAGVWTGVFLVALVICVIQNRYQHD